MYSLCHTSEADLMKREETREAKHVYFFHKAGLMTFKTISWMLAGNTIFRFGLRSLSPSNLVIFGDLAKLQPKMPSKSPAT